MNHGFLKVACAIPKILLANCRHNREQVENLLDKSNAEGADIVCFPQLCISGYSCNDLFLQQTLLNEAENALSSLLQVSQGNKAILVVGLPVRYTGHLFNCAAVIQNGRLCALVPKTILPSMGDADERRWFTSSLDLAENEITICGQQVPIAPKIIFRCNTFSFGIEIGQESFAPFSPSDYMALAGADIILNPTTITAAVTQRDVFCETLIAKSRRCKCGYVSVSNGYGESTQDAVYQKNAIIIENGKVLASSSDYNYDDDLLISEIDIERIRAARLQDTTYADTSRIGGWDDILVVKLEEHAVLSDKLTRHIDAHPFMPQNADVQQRCNEIFEMQIQALARRFQHTHSQSLVVGISGGLDSTLALLVCVHTLDLLNLPRKNVIGITMPGFGTTDRTYNNALNLMKQLDITTREISIRNACLQHFQDIGHDADNHNTTYENAQARERTQILMDVANQCNSLVIGTGDMSELALGWATYNGDHMSMYGVNGGIPKTIIQHVVRNIAMTRSDEATRKTLLDILDTPISPELIPANDNGTIKQKTEDLVGPYELHDFFLYYFLRWGFRPKKIYFLAQQAFSGCYDDDTIKKWLRTFLRRFFQQQFKRSCLPDGPKVGSCSLSPRGGLFMPTDADSSLWTAEVDEL